MELVNEFTDPIHFFNDCVRTFTEYLLKNLRIGFRLLQIFNREPNRKERVFNFVCHLPCGISPRRGTLCRHAFLHALLQVPCHLIEPFRQLSHLVTRLDFNAMIKIPRRDMANPLT